MRPIRYRPPTSSPLHERCNPPVMRSLMGIRFIQEVDNARAGDAYHDASTGEVFIWSGDEWVHLGAGHVTP